MIKNPRCQVMPNHFKSLSPSSRNDSSLADSKLSKYLFVALLALMYHGLAKLYQNFFTHEGVSDFQQIPQRC